MLLGTRFLLGFFLHDFACLGKIKFNLYFVNIFFSVQFELKEMKRRQEEEERRIAEELAAKQTPPVTSPVDR